MTTSISGGFHIFCKSARSTRSQSEKLIECLCGDGSAIYLYISVKVTKTMCGADCWTDHRLVVSKLNLRIQPAWRPQGKKAPKRLDVSKLNKDSMRQDFLTDICNQLDAMNLSSEDPEENWTVFHKTVLSSAAAP